MKYRNIFCWATIFVFLAIFAIISAYSRQDEHTVVDFKKRISVEKPVTQESSGKVIRIAIGAMVSPKETFSAYQDLIDYMSSKLNKSFAIVQRKTYQEINEMLGNGQVELAFICSGPYIIGKETHSMELLVAPEVNGSHFYRSYLIVNRNSQANSLDDLRGLTFAFTDPDSNTGKLSPTSMLARMGESPESFFGSIIYTYSHDNSILAVSRGLVNGAAVDSLIWDYFNKTRPEITSFTRIIGKSEEYGIPPVVVSKGVDKELTDSIRNAFLTMNSDTQGKEILSRLLIDRFVEAEDSWYDSIRNAVTDKRKN